MSTTMPTRVEPLTGQPALVNGPQWEWDPALSPDLDQLVTEDGKPVDNIYVERQYGLLRDPLYVSWKPPGENRTMVVVANVGWFFQEKQPGLAPDLLLSLDVDLPDPRSKEGRSYIQWVLGKPPDLAIEIVSDRTGGEEGYKMDRYARQGLSFYVIYDPDMHLSEEVLRVFELRGRRYKAISANWIEELGLGLTLWEGTYLGAKQTWLRWCDKEGKVLATPEESRDAERSRADRLAAKLRELGVDPDAL